MGRSITRFVELCVAVVLGVVLSACGSTSSPSAEQAFSDAQSTNASMAIAGLHNEGELSVGVKSSSQAPLLMESGGDIGGMEVEIACAIADEMGLPVSFHYVTDVADSLGTTCDFVMDAPKSSDKYKVLGKVGESAIALFRKGEPGVVTVEDLEKKSVAVQDGSAAQVLLRTTSLDCTEVPYDTLDKAFKAVSTGAADYVLCHAMSGAYLATRHEGISFAGTINEPTYTGIAIALGDGEVQKAVKAAYKAIENNGVLKEIRQHWLGSMPRLTGDSQIANIPMRQTDGDAPELTFEAEIVSTGAMDGSNAGANAASFSQNGEAQQTQQDQAAPLEQEYAPVPQTPVYYQPVNDYYEPVEQAPAATYEAPAQEQPVVDQYQDSEASAEGNPTESYDTQTDFGDTQAVSEGATEEY